MSTTLLHVTTVPMSLTFLKGQVGYMTARGLEVHAISSPGPDLDAFARSEGVEVSGVEMQRRITPLRDLRALTQILAVMWRKRPTIVHAHTPKGGLLGMIAAWIHGAPVRIYHLRGLPLMGATGWRRRLLWATEWVAARLAHRVLCVSHSLRREAVEAGLCPAEKIEVLLGGSGNGVDATGRFCPDGHAHARGVEVRDRFGIPHDAVVVGFVGRLVPDKGIVELIEAWRDLRRRYVNAHLLLVGPLESETPLPAETVRQLHADDRIHLAGMDWNTPPLFAAMDLVALPTYREGFPNVPLEAAAMRLPVVATRIPGCIDAVVDGVTGLLVEARDATALRHALATYLDDPERRRRDGEAARNRVIRDFSPERIWEEIHREYQALMQMYAPQAIVARTIPGDSGSPSVSASGTSART